MKTFGLSVLAAIVGYVVGFFGEMLLVETLSSNPHDKSVEAAMTGASVVGAVVANLAAIATVIYRSRQRRTD